MRRSQIIASILLGLAAGPASAQVECTLIQDLTRFQSAPADLAGTPVSRADATARQQLAADMLRHDGDSVRFALRDHARPAEAAALADFADLSAELARLSQTGQTPAMERLAALPESRRILAAARAALPRFDCAAPPVTARMSDSSDGADRSDPAPADQPTAVESSQINLVVTIPFVLAALLAVAAGLYLVMRTREKRRRRARRYTTNRPVRFRIGTRTCEGKLLDISCLGAKLQHGGAIHDTDAGPIMIRLAGQWHRAERSWGNAHYAGLRFQTKLTLPYLLQVLATPPRLFAQDTQAQTKNGAPKAPLS